jgi:hypothetical protein
VRYLLIQTIHTFTHTYINNTCIYMQYMHIQAHTCMHQSRSRGVFGGLWKTLYVSRSNTTSPMGWDGAWVKLGLGRQARIWPGTPPSRAWGAVQGPPTVAEGGGCAKSGCRRAQGWSQKVLAPMTWGTFSCMAPRS